jgi:hypothetical protein
MQEGYYWFYRLTLTQTNTIITTQVFDDFKQYIHAINPGVNLGILKDALDMINFDTIIDKGEYQILRTKYPLNYDYEPIV